MFWQQCSEGHVQVKAEFDRTAGVAQTQVWGISHHDGLCPDHIQRLQHLLLATHARIRECMTVFNQKQGIRECRSRVKSSLVSEDNWDACIGIIQ